jgi:hypothetical protein
VSSSRDATRAPATVLVTRPVGYALELSPGAVDAGRFEDLVQQAIRHPDMHQSLTMIEEALRLWRAVEQAVLRQDDTLLAPGAPDITAPRAPDITAPFGQPQAARNDLNRALGLAQSHKLAPALFVIRLGLSVLAQAEGRWEESETHLREAETVQATWDYLWAHGNRPARPGLVPPR